MIRAATSPITIMLITFSTVTLTTAPSSTIMGTAFSIVAMPLHFFAHSLIFADSLAGTMVSGVDALAGISRSLRKGRCGQAKHCDERQG